MFKLVSSLVSVCLLTACGGSIVECREDAWASSEGPPVAAVGPAAPFAPEAVAVVLGPFPDGAIVDEVELGGAPGWGCSAPDALPVAAWSSTSERPAGDPLHRASPSPVLETADLGEGFTSRRVALAETVFVRRGGFLTVAMALDRSDACGAKTTGAVGRSWRWRDGAWAQLDGELVARVDGCVEQ